MATQVFVINATADLKIQVDGAADAALTTISAGDAAVNFFANGKRSVDIDSSEIVRVTSLAHSAGTAQVSSIDLSGVAASTTEYVKIINTTLGTMNLPVMSFEGDDAAAIKALMDDEFGKADSEFEGFSAAVSGQTITITAPINSSFRLAGAEGSSITYTTNMSPSVGLADDVTALYDQYAGYDGITNRVGFPVVRPTSPVDSDIDYDICVLAAVTKASSKDGMSAQKGEYVKLIFAVNTDATACNLAVGTATTGIDVELAQWQG